MRKTGILTAISSLPGKMGIGDFGKEAYEFIDIIADAKIKLWQILPLNPVGYGNSPYQPYSSYAGDEVYIGLDGLIADGLLSIDEIEEKLVSTNKAEYEIARNIKTKYLKLAYQRFSKNSKSMAELETFKKENYWVNIYAVFIMLKKKNNLSFWLEWPIKDQQWIINKNFDELEDLDAVEYEIFVQYIFYKQWFELKAYANKKGIEILGDIPIYVGIDSSDVWDNKLSFLLDDKSHPTFIAGVPPDYFSATGQRWGNPLYDWDYLEKNNFDFWIERLKWCDKIYDITRIDHFRAFDTYWKIPASCETAIEGKWVEAPGYALFDEIYKQMPNIKIVAEDLGDLREEVLILRDHYKLSGMKIIQFELDPKENNNNFKEKKNTIVYTGTHDNQTIKGWYDGLSTHYKRKVGKMFSSYPQQKIPARIVNNALDSISDLVVLPVQDILLLGDEARINTPGTIGTPNWEWKLKDYKKLSKELKSLKEMILNAKRGKEMNFGAVFHRASENWCYAIDENIIEVKIKTDYDVERIFFHHGDPFENGILGGNEKWTSIRVEIVEQYKLKYHKIWVIRVKPPYKRVKYYFELHSHNEVHYYFEDGFMTQVELDTTFKSLQCFTMPWLNPIDVKKTPDWVKNAVWYQIFPDRFNRGDKTINLDSLKWDSRKPKNEDKYGGDLQGIINRLDYLEDLGITGIYLNPIFTATSTHKYDTINYFDIDPVFGNKDKFKELVAECHRRNIKVMLDGVFNHVGEEFPYWQDVIKNGKNSVYYDWFMVNDWPFDVNKYHTRDLEFYSFAFYANMPKLNTNNPEVINYIIKICEFWIKEYNIDGWRIDVANEISHMLCKEIHKRCKAINPDIYILGEIWHDSINWLRGDEFDSVMNYPLTTTINEFWFNKNLINKDFEYQVNNCYQRYMTQTNKALFNMLDSHDTDRLFHRVNQNADIFYQQMILLFTMCGSISLYYGTEIMLDGGFDPGCRACMPWNKIDKGNYASTINNFKQLIQLRKEHKALRSLKISFNYNYNERVIDYIKDNSIRVIINASNEEIIIDNEEVLFSNKLSNSILLPNGVVIIKLKKE